MDVDEVAKQPSLNPTLRQILGRLELHRDGGRLVTSIAMSAESLERLKADPDAGAAVTRNQSRWEIYGVPVRLYEGQLGVGMGFEQH